jgi:hypothetical protein
MHYKDKTFCSFYESCFMGADCNRALTQRHIDRAKNLALRICKYEEKPDCYREGEK